MDVSSKISDKTNRRHSDTFLSDAVHGRTKKHVSYGDGFRFGVGFILANLTMGLIVGGIAWGLVTAFHIH